MKMRIKKILSRVIIVILLIIAVYFGAGLNISEDQSDCEIMAPYAPNVDANYSILDFSEKYRLTPNKFGFRRKLVVKTDSVLIQRVGGPPKSNAYYGVYADKELKKPIESANFKWLYRDGSFEEGLTDEVPYDKKKDGIIVLKAGTYYTAVYTNLAFDEFEAYYLSYICPLTEKCKLDEGKEAFFYAIEDEQKNTFEILPNKQGRIKITTNIVNEGKVALYDENHKLVSRKSATSGKFITICFDAKRGKRYYAEISNLSTDREADFMYVYSIKYKYIK